MPAEGQHKIFRKVSEILCFEENTSHKNDQQEIDMGRDPPEGAAEKFSGGFPFHDLFEPEPFENLHDPEEDSPEHEV